jgi:SMODS-associating 2TM, beta-strand rich effector domain
MFKMFKPTFFVLPIAWLTVLVLAALDGITPLLEGAGLSPRTSWGVVAVQAVVTIIFATPLWRAVWRWFPSLNHYVYPDLNGEWDVELETNWPRIDRTLKAANGEELPIDMREGPEEALPALGNMVMRARIKQTWLTMKMDLWNPAGLGASPIRESQTLLVAPFQGEDGRHGLAYIYEQENATDVVSDDAKFKGAAWIVRDRDDPNVLCGRMWNDRMWRRGMNTAAELRFTRRAT